MRYQKESHSRQDEGKRSRRYKVSAAQFGVDKTEASEAFSGAGVSLQY